MLQFTKLRVSGFKSFAFSPDEIATQRGSRHYPSMLEDVEAHRPTEIEHITGALVREAGNPAAARVNHVGYEAYSDPPMPVSMMTAMSG